MTNDIILAELFSKQFELPLDTVKIEKVLGFTAINGKIPMQISTNLSFDRSNYVTVKNINEDDMGEIHFLKDVSSELASIPETHYIAFLIENDGNPVTSITYTFKYDYLILNIDYCKDYLANYDKSSALWGSFMHIETMPESEDNVYSASNIIYANPNIKNYNNTLYQEILSTIHYEANPFSRFLKYYHLLEMHFDMHTANRIKQLLDQQNKEKEISSLLRDYNRDDIDRLISLINTYIDLNVLTKKLTQIFNFKQIADKVFYEFGKASNPLRKKTDFDAICRKGSFSENEIKMYIGSMNYQKFLSSLAAYWIYRIRSSIAHNKLGEYIMTNQDKSFIINFAEPLIKAILIDFYSKWES